MSSSRNEHNNADETLQVGSSHAVMIIGVDSEVDDDSLKLIESLSGIEDARYVKLKGKI
jgi:hypothetical protein